MVGTLSVSVLMTDWATIGRLTKRGGEGAGLPSPPLPSPAHSMVIDCPALPRVCSRHRMPIRERHERDPGATGGRWGASISTWVAPLHKMEKAVSQRVYRRR